VDDDRALVLLSRRPSGEADEAAWRRVHKVLERGGPSGEPTSQAERLAEALGDQEPFWHLALLSAEGAELWRIPAHEQVFAVTPLPSENLVVFQVPADGRVETEAHSLDDGRLLWTHRWPLGIDHVNERFGGGLPSEDHPFFEPLREGYVRNDVIRSSATLRAVEDRIYLFNEPGEDTQVPSAAALDARTGRTLWRAPMPAVYPFGPRFVAFRGAHLFVSVHESRDLVAIHRDTGAWQRIETNRPLSLCAWDDAVLMLSDEGEIIRIDAGDLSQSTIDRRIFGRDRRQHPGREYFVACGAHGDEKILIHRLPRVGSRIASYGARGRELAWEQTLPDVTYPAWGRETVASSWHPDDGEFPRHIPLTGTNGLLMVYDLAQRSTTWKRRLPEEGVLRGIRAGGEGFIMYLRREDTYRPDREPRTHIEGLLALDGPSGSLRLGLTEPNELVDGTTWLAAERVSPRRLWARSQGGELLLLDLRSLRPRGLRLRAWPIHDATRRIHRFFPLPEEALIAGLI